MIIIIIIMLIVILPSAEDDVVAIPDVMLQCVEDHLVVHDGVVEDDVLGSTIHLVVRLHD